ncbi:outer membrane protein assembly factor BamE [Arboricoccus pini]|uniref:outer membrane protein assembly factor BamE n=1 Tax=Arboricoccus pini TaxID=1963835 RepID=UPI0013FD2FE5|nr:outer membrane protein assembly factor BamE [Arboricoccus pini]
MSIEQIGARLENSRLVRLFVVGLATSTVSAGCTTAPTGPLTSATAADIKVGTTREQVLSTAGQPLAETTQSPGRCLDYQTKGADEALQPFHVVLTPNERVYETGDGNCASVAVHG